MKRDLSVRTRLTVWYTAVLSLGLVLFSLTVWLALRHTLIADLEASLLNQARGFDEYLRIEDQDHDVDLVRETIEYSQSWPNDHILVVYDNAGKAIYTSAPGGPDRFAKFEAFAGSARPVKIRWRGRTYLAVARPIRLREGNYWAFLAISSASTGRAIELLGWLLVLAVPLFVLCAAGGGYLLSRRALRPVDKITERARTIGLDNLSERLVVPKTNDELQRLTETWNAMLERLATAVSRISRFTADASHELRTPVAIIRLAAENALRRNRSEYEYRSALERIQKESEDMTRLIGDLLFLARADVAAVTNEPEIVLLQEIVNDACQDLGALASAKGIALTKQMPECPLNVLGSSSDLRRMLLILLDNAIKYTPAQGFVLVGVERAEGCVTLRVEDNGIGIPEEMRGQVFQRFFRVDPSRNRESGGYGLGLSIAQTIVQQHNAAIELQSRPGGGCVFLVSLPLAFEEVAQNGLATIV